MTHFFDDIKSRRGFQAMSPERRAEVAGIGGRKAHQLGKAHRFTPEEASAAGKKGAASRAANRIKTKA